MTADFPCGVTGLFNGGAADFSPYGGADCRAANREFSAAIRRSGPKNTKRTTRSRPAKIVRMAAVPRLVSEAKPALWWVHKTPRPASVAVAGYFGASHGLLGRVHGQNGSDFGTKLRGCRGPPARGRCAQRGKLMLDFYEKLNTQDHAIKSLLVARRRKAPPSCPSPRWAPAGRARGSVRRHRTLRCYSS